MTALGAWEGTCWRCRGHGRGPVPAAVPRWSHLPHLAANFCFCERRPHFSFVAAEDPRCRGCRMAHSVLYADLRFAKGPWGRGTASRALGEAPGTDEADSPYENVAPGPAPMGTAGEGTRHSPGRCSRRRCIPAGLLAASLLLLVALVALGTCYWQATRELRDTSLEQAAERGRFSQEARAWEQSLEQARRELAQARAELQRAWREGNSSLLELGRQEAELARVSGALAGTERELQDVQGRLEAGERTASSLRACLDADCCPPGWLLYNGKCLFVSSEKKSWWQSRSDCEARSSQLLVHSERQAWALPTFLHTGGTKYWVEEEVSSATGLVVRQDSVLYDTHAYSDKCSLSAAKGIERLACRRLHQWICEQPPRLSSMSKALTSLLDEE
ncbi:B-cell differentiation antigen CD72-like isoform X2 [Anser cygnoides]|uniref:B-cell differentiation antigen CD72-like isoform X2 n=1 Tax=Anser cygnoides TaxID=8845 RepID=UPI0034D26A00